MHNASAPIDLLHAIPAPSIAALPKADLHVHTETDARLGRVLARRDGHSPFAWSDWLRELVAETPPGMERLAAMALARRFEAATVDALDADLLDEAAADGTLYVEVIFGAATVMRAMIG